jgi:alkyl hydroperoxide reductase subunit F
MSKVYDLIILGAGPAGITASVYAARKKLDFLVITKDIGGQAAISGDIENYTGYQFISGPELAYKFEEHMNSFGIEIKMPEEAKEIIKQNNLVKAITDKGEYLSKTLIVATGKRPRELNIEGEKEFRNKGLTYCATCDGPLFKGKNVAVIGGGNSALDAALQMVKISPKVYIININSQLMGDSIMIEKITESPNAEIWNNSQVKRVYGEAFVKGVEVEKEGVTHNLNVEGVFVEIGLIPNSDCASILKRNGAKEVVVDCYNKTNIEGVFAAGDVTNVPEKQIIIACGEGSKASLAAFKYLSTHNF